MRVPGIENLHLWRDVLAGQDGRQEDADARVDERGGDSLEQHRRFLHGNSRYPPQQWASKSDYFHVQKDEQRPEKAADNAE